MKKLSIVLALLLVCTFVFASCGEAGKLVGTWETSGLVTTSYTFNKDGTGVYSVAGVGVNFTYTLSDGKLIVTTGETGISVTYTYTIEKDVLTMTVGTTSVSYTKAK